MTAVAICIVEAVNTGQNIPYTLAIGQTEIVHVTMCDFNIYFDSILVVEVEMQRYRRTTRE
jgi:hypothetical protein